jgi:CheY-like chemotaxis protein
MRVLVVEDSEDTAESLRILLGVWGHDARVVHDGASALAVLDDAWRVDVMLLDIGLPDMSGWEVANRAARHPKAPVVIVLSGQDPDPKLRPAGVRWHVKKPVDPLVLRTLLDASIGPEWLDPRSQRPGDGQRVRFRTQTFRLEERSGTFRARTGSPIGGVFVSDQGAEFGPTVSDWRPEALPMVG